MSEALATLNALLLHGARHHDRNGVFLHWDGREWVVTPDWRADRHTVRIALALCERFGVAPGDRVALAMSLRPEWPLVERAIWGLGAICIPAPRDDDGPVVVFSDRSDRMAPSGSVRGVISLDDGSWDELLDYGGVLDTPERATYFRALARATPPEALASIEEGREWTHAVWVERIERFRARHPPERGKTHKIASEDPTMAARVAIYSGWSDGLTRTAFGAPEAGTDPDSFVALSPERTAGEDRTERI